jgi:hypothetical protein
MRAKNQREHKQWKTMAAAQLAAATVMAIGLQIV